VLGGTQSLHTNSLDETWALPTEKAAKIALRTQQILAFETGVANTVDPLAGSYYLENLTTKMEQEAEEYFEKIDALGGVIPAIKQGFFQREIAAAARQYQEEIEKKERLIVGVNAFAEPEEKLDIPILRIDPSVEKQQIGNLKKLRSERDLMKVKQYLTRLKEAAQDNRNLMPAIIDCSRAYCTLGEIINELKSVYGTWREEPVF